MQVVIVTIHFPNGQTNVSAFSTMEKATDVMQVLGMNDAVYSWAIVTLDKLGDWDLR